MEQKIYKYFSHHVLDLVFAKEGVCRVKCAFPVEYNDPFELFLGIDPKCGPELLAVYREIVYEIPQRPTTCFSKSPIVTPMWAHYSSNHSGFAIEFDRKSVEAAFPNGSIGDITYRDVPDPNIEQALLRAAVTKKPRHAIWLQQGVMSAAYFSKHSCWSYEEECRFVASSSDITDVAGSMILEIPMSAVTSIIVGKNFPPDLFEKSQKLANGGDVEWYVAQIGKSHPQPFFKSAEGDVFVFQDGQLKKSPATCGACSEPVGSGGELCPWCSIQERDEIEAALGNPLRMLDRIGRLDSYLDEVEKIERSRER